MTRHASARINEDTIENSRLLMDSLQDDTKGFERLAALLKNVAGINLPTNSKNLCLMASRLSHELKKYGLSGYKEYYELVQQGHPEVMGEFIRAMTTNTTHFFREPKHFEIFQSVLQTTIQQKEREHSREIRIWCSAASTGQEPYTILMSALSAIPDPSAWSVQFLATDIDRDVLAKASRGVYTENEIEGIPANLRQSFLTAHAGKNGTMYAFKQQYRDAIRFAEFNLLTEPYPFKHPFDFVFCRNVLIYFDKDTAQTVVNRMALTLRPGGYLFLGHSESGMMKSEHLKPIATAAYQRTSDKWKK